MPTLDYGIYPHQVMMFPSGRTALIVDRGNKAQAGKAEEPGALRTFGFDDGDAVGGRTSSRPTAALASVRAMSTFHPAKPWLYASDERTNRLYMFRYQDDRLEAEPAFTRDTLADPAHVRPRQIAGPIHVHPSGPLRLCGQPRGSHRRARRREGIRRRREQHRRLRHRSRAPASPRWCSMPTRTRFTCAPSPATPAAGCW